MQNSSVLVWLDDGMPNLLPDWVLRGRLLVAEVGADEHQWDGDPEPEEAEGEQGAEGDGAGGLLSPDEKVEGKEDAEAGA